MRFTLDVCLLSGSVFGHSPGNIYTFPYLVPQITFCFKRVHRKTVVTQELGTGNQSITRLIALDTRKKTQNKLHGRARKMAPITLRCSLSIHFGPEILYCVSKEKSNEIQYSY